MLLHDAIDRYCRLHLEATWTRWKPAIALCETYLTRLPNVELAAVTRVMVGEWARTIVLAGTPVQAHNAVAHLRLCYRKMIEWNLYDGANPAQYAPVPRPKPRRVTLPTSAMPTLMACLLRRPDDVRLYFLTIMILGVRRDEARLMRWQDLDLMSGVWTIPQTKNEDPHWLTVPADLLHPYRALQRERQADPPDARIFPWSHGTVHRSWAKLRKEAGLEHLHLHDLRRTLITFFCNQGQAPLAQIIANHKSRATTERYWQRGQSVQVTEALEAYAKRVLGQQTLA